MSRPQGGPALAGPSALWGKMRGEGRTAAPTTAPHLEVAAAAPSGPLPTIPRVLAKLHRPGFEPLSYAEILAAVPQIEVDLPTILKLPQSEQLQVLAELREWEQVLKQNPLRGYTPAGLKHHHFHMAVHDHDTRLIAGGNRAAKTTSAVADDLIQATPWELLPEHLWQYKRFECPFTCRVFGTDLDRQIRQVIHQKFREWTPKALFKNGSFDKSYTQKGDILQLECGCRFDFLSYEVDLNKLGGVARHRVHYDEEPPESFRSEGLFRLADFGGDELYSMTPQKGLSWPYRAIWKKRGKPPTESDPRRYWAEAIKSTDNRFVSRDELMKALAGVTNEAERKQRMDGTFAETGGQVFPNFLSRLIPRPPKEHVSGLSHLVLIDPGIRFAGLVWMGFDRDNYGLIYEALKLRDTSADQFPEYFRRVAAEWGFDPKHADYIIDPAARNRELATGVSVQGILAAMGWQTRPAQNDVNAGIQAVRRRLNDGALLVGDWLTDLHDEAVEYSFEDREDETDKVKKRNDHLMDPVRYGCMERLWTPLPKKLILPAGVTIATGPPKRRVQASVGGAMT